MRLPRLAWVSLPRALLVLLLVSLAGSVFAAGRPPLVAGSARVVYRMTGPGFVPTYANSGFRQEVEGDGLDVHVRVEGGEWTRAPFHLPHRAAGQKDAVALFAAAAARGARLRAEAVGKVLQAIAGRILYVDEDNGVEAPLDVLREGRARCVGLANLSVAALRSIGIEARVARGLLVDPGSGRAVPHRWLEVFYPDAGWVFSDPTESVNYVSPYHVVVTPPGDPDPDYEPAWAAALELRLVRALDGLLSVDARPGSRGPLAERKLGRAQFQAAVLGRVLPPGEGSVRLEGVMASYETDVPGSGLFAFPGLDAGTYRLVARFGARSTVQAVRVLDAEVVRVEVRVP